VDNIGSLVVEAAGRHGLAGVAVAAVGPGVPPTMVCQGAADASGGRPVDPDTVFRVASVTKTMTAIGLMQLQEAGCFGLDDPVNDYLSAFQIQPPPGGPPVTFRHLLTHTAGIGELPRIADALRPAARGLARPGTPPADLAALFRSRGASNPARYSRNPRRCAKRLNRSSNRAAYSSSGPGAAGQSRCRVITHPRAPHDTNPGIPRTHFRVNKLPLVL
jgi:CubicO group peptidase (beta-lactamase class C family)